jgi:hypothetical protein
MTTEIVIHRFVWSGSASGLVDELSKDSGKGRIDVSNYDPAEVTVYSDSKEIASFSFYAEPDSDELAEFFAKIEFYLTRPTIGPKHDIGTVNAILAGDIIEDEDEDDKPWLGEEEDDE